jgi:hypothetical protein
MPLSEGLRAHVELARISGIIVCETFRVAPRQPQMDSSTSSIDTALAMLQSWQAQLPPSLRMPEDLRHIDPSCCILHMAHNQLVLLTTRPIFFSAVKQTVAQQVVQSRSPTEQHSQRLHVHLCATTAHRNLLLARRITESSRKLLQAGLHFVFNAAVILLLNRIMSMQGIGVDHDIGHSRPNVTTHEQLESDIHFAMQTFQNEARTGTNYPRDCYRVLQDLKALTDRYIASRYSTMDQIHSTGDDFSSLGLPIAQPQLGATDGVYEEMMTWVQSDGLQLHDGLFI